MINVVIRWTPPTEYFLLKQQVMVSINGEQPVQVGGDLPSDAREITAPFVEGAKLVIFIKTIGTNDSEKLSNSFSLDVVNNSVISAATNVTAMCVP
jgi:hypothetical protein